MFNCSVLIQSGFWLWDILPNSENWRDFDNQRENIWIEIENKSILMLLIIAASLKL